MPVPQPPRGRVRTAALTGGPSPLSPPKPGPLLPHAPPSLRSPPSQPRRPRLPRVPSPGATRTPGTELLRSARRSPPPAGHPSTWARARDTARARSIAVGQTSERIPDHAEDRLETRLARRLHTCRPRAGPCREFPRGFGGSRPRPAPSSTALSSLGVCFRLAEDLCMT